MNNSIDAFLELNPLVDGLLRATAILSLACIADALPQSKNPRWRVLVSRATVLCILALPCMLLFAPTWDLAVLPRVESEALTSQPEAVRESVQIPTAPMSQPPQVDSTSEARPSPARVVPYSLLFIALCVSVAAGLVLASMLRYGMILRRARRGDPAPQAIRNLSAHIARDLGLSIEPEVFLDASARVPYVIGCFRPVVVLPSQMATETYAADLPSILSHELVHIQQRDTIWIPLLHLLKQAAWFHPLAWRLQHVHAEACEAVCDARAAQYVGGSERYAGCLARVALELAGVRRRDAMAVPMVRGPRVTRRLRELDRGLGAAPLRRRPVWTATLLLLALAILLANVNLVRAQDSSTEADTGPAELFEITTSVTPYPSTEQEHAGRENVNTVIPQELIAPEDADSNIPFAGMPLTEPGGEIVGRTAILLAQQTPDADEGAESTAKNVARIEKILENPVGLEFHDAHISVVLDFLSDTYDLKFKIDDRVCAPSGWEGTPGEGNTYRTDGNVQYISIRNVTIDQALKAVLRPLGLAYSIDSELIRIHAAETDSPAAVSGRVAISEVFESEPSEQESEASLPGNRIHDILTYAASFTFKEVHLQEILDFISETYDINIIVDGRVVRPPGRRWPDEGTYVTDGRVEYIKLMNLSLAQAFESLLEPRGLTYSVQSTFIWISTPNNIARETFEELETRFYQLSEEEFLALFPALQEDATRAQPDPKASSIKPDQMSDQLREIMPELHKPTTGKAISFLRYNRVTGVLVIHHTPSAHQKFAELIASLFGAPLNSETLNEEELETRDYTMKEGKRLLIMSGIFEGPVAMTQDDMTYFISPPQADTHVFPEIREPKNSETVSWQRYDAAKNLLTIHHTPSAFAEFEALIQKNGWMIRRTLK